MSGAAEVLRLLGPAPVTGLADIGAADLAARTERKHLLTLDRFAELAGGLRATHRLLEVEGRTCFGYLSAYDDTPQLTCFHDHRQGRRLRWKARTRTWQDSGLQRYEVKLKDGRGATDKHSVVLEGDEPARRARSRAMLGRVLAERYGVAAPAVLVPALEVGYVRVTLVARDGSSRTTVDSDLVVAAAGGGRARLLGDAVVVETKSRDGRSAADALLARAGVRPVALSKYCVGTALTRADVPDQPWRPLLRRWFVPVDRPQALVA